VGAGDRAGESRTLEREGGDPSASHPRARSAGDGGGGGGSDLVGRTLLHFRVVERLGEGGMGVVYKAIDEKLRRPVALKALASRYLVDDRNRELIFREARSAAALSHPNIAAIHEVHEGAGGDGAFYVMELVEGETLRQRIGRAGRVPVAEALRLGLQIARALARAHQAGVVHRDLKADNVMITPAGDVKLLDFGLAKVVDVADPVVVERGAAAAPPVAAAALAPTVPASDPSTEHGRVMGTPAYMAPEQARGGDVDARADVFAFGVVLYEMTTGTTPFAKRAGMPWTWGDAGSGDWKPHARVRELAPEVPGDVEKLVTRCLAFEPGARFADGASLATAVEQCSRHVERARRTRVAVVLGLVAIAAAAVVSATAARRASLPGAASVAPSAPAAAAPSDSAIRWVDLPPPITSSAPALQSFLQGRTLLHDARGGSKALFRRATELDPGFAAAYLYVVVANGPGLQTRDEYRKAAELADQLGTRDRDLLDALQPAFGREPSDRAETLERLSRLVAKRPNDAELWCVRAQYQPDGAATIADLDRALQLDPSYAWALYWRAGQEAEQGDEPQALRAYDRCLLLVPDAANCLGARGALLAARGECAAAQKDVDQTLLLRPTDVTYAELAELLAAQDRPTSELRDAVSRARTATIKNDTGFVPTWALEGIGIDEISGNLADAAHAKEVLATRLSTSPPEWFADWQAVGLVVLYEEMGDATAVARIASTHLALPQHAATNNLEVGPVALGVTLPLSAAMVRAGRLSPAELARRRAAFVAAQRERGTDAWLSWANLAATVESPREAAEALDAFGLVPAPPPKMDPSTASDWGRTLVLAGRAADAIPMLEGAMRSCSPLSYALDQTRASFFLGLAREATGDRAGACNAYGTVLRRWGHATPRSRTADAARRRVHALACPP
jgi:serine/threonine-protein kinase